MLLTFLFVVYNLSVTKNRGAGDVLKAFSGGAAVVAFAAGTSG